MEHTKMRLGDVVERVKGHDKWPGIIVADFLTTKGERRYVVECIVLGSEGTLTIYAPEQLRVIGKLEMVSA